MKGSVGDAPRRRLLAIAYFFPPFFSAGASVRIVKFLKYLARLDWQATVLTVDDRQEYEHLRRDGCEELLGDLPADLAIVRTGAGEPAANLIEAGRQARKKNRLTRLAVNALRDLRNWGERWLLIPDENVMWFPFAVRVGLRTLRQQPVDVLFVTCPPYSAALVGAVLSLLARKPLVLDFRDDWVNTPWFWQKPWLVRVVNRWLERRVVARATRVVVVTPASRDAFRQRYPRHAVKFELIPNGVDLEDFAVADGAERPASKGKFSIVHAGLLTTSADWQRSPEGFFRALAEIRETEPDIYRQLQVTFTGRLPDRYRERLFEAGLDEVVQEVGYLPREEYVALLHDSDLLLALNYAGYATLIPGKIYEYWAVGGPPILLLGQPGAAQDLLDKYSLGLTVAPNDHAAIAARLVEMVRCRMVGQPMRISRAGIESFDRAALATHLARTLEDVLAG